VQAFSSLVSDFSLNYKDNKFLTDYCRLIGNKLAFVYIINPDSILRAFEMGATAGLATSSWKRADIINGVTVIESS